MPSMKEQKAPDNFEEQKVSDIYSVKSQSQVKTGGLLGEGAFGEVFLIEYEEVEYAMKVINKAKVIKALDGSEERYIAMRDRELLVSRVATKMDYCVKFFSYWEEDGKEYYIYELCDKGDL